MTSEPSNNGQHQNQGQDAGPSRSSALSEDSSFHPTTVLYITPHNSFHRYIKIYTIHRDLNETSYTTLDDLLRDASKTGDSIPSSEAPALTIHQGGIFWGSGKVYAGQFPCEKNDTAVSSPIAEWKPCHIPHGTNVFTFMPPASTSTESTTAPTPATEPAAATTFAPTHRHPLTLQRTTVISSRAEYFVKDSVQYVWRFDSRPHDTRMTLYAQVGGKDEVVAKALRPWRIENTGGAVAVDEGAVDALSVVLTTVGMWRKLRLRTHR